MTAWLELSESYRRFHEDSMANLRAMLSQSPMDRSFAFPWNVVAQNPQQAAEEPLRAAVTAVVACVYAETDTLEEKRRMLHQIALAFALMANDPQLGTGHE